MLNTILSIVLFIIAFGVLICIHEAGHLSMAKLFNVYCKEYSIGFGSAIFSRKGKGKETKFSIRAIPFGGYVAMYGEGMEDDPEFKDIPKERSLEGIKKWKKAIILSAGVILNAFLALILIFISNVAFPKIAFTRETIVTSEVLTSKGIQSGDHIKFVYPDFKEEDGSVYAFTYEYTDKEKLIHANSFFIIDPDVQIEGTATHVVLAYMPTGNKGNPNFSEGLMLYPAVAKADLETKFVYDTELKKDLLAWSKQEGSPDYYPSYEEGLYTSDKDYEFNTRLLFEGKEGVDITIKATASTKAKKVVNTFEDIGLEFKTAKVWEPFGTSLKNTFIDYGSAASAVFRGLKVLFTGGIRNMSGVVGIFDTSATLLSNYTFATYLYFWGLISVNLAIFNLLPFPGLDGWQLLVTAIEGITRKKIPQKAKTIVSLIGIGLLFVLMGAIIVLDILRIIGI